VGPRNHVLDGDPDRFTGMATLAVSGPLKSIGSQCCENLQSKKSITATAGVWAAGCNAAESRLVSVTFDITLSPVKNPPPAMRPFAKIL